MSKNKSEDYKPIDYRVNKDLKSIKTRKGENTRLNSQTFKIFFTVIAIAGLLLLYNFFSSNHEKNELETLRTEIKQLKENHNMVVDSLHQDYKVKIDNLNTIIRDLGGRNN